MAIARIVLVVVTAIIAIAGTVYFDSRQRHEDDVIANVQREQKLYQDHISRTERFLFDLQHQDAIVLNVLALGDRWRSTTVSSTVVKNALFNAAIDACSAADTSKRVDFEVQLLCHNTKGLGGIYAQTQLTPAALWTLYKHVALVASPFLRQARNHIAYWQNQSLLRDHARDLAIRAKTRYSTWQSALTIAAIVVAMIQGLLGDVSQRE